VNYKDGREWVFANKGGMGIGIMKSILSVVPAPRKIRRVGKAWGRALPIEFVELSRTESYGY
jgi:hypothetical protein